MLECTFLVVYIYGGRELCSRESLMQFYEATELSSYIQPLKQVVLSHVALRFMAITKSSPVDYSHKPSIGLLGSCEPHA